jgi:hypothetical protein
MFSRIILLGGLLVVAWGCGHGVAAGGPGDGLGVECARGAEGACGAEGEEREEGRRTKGGTVSARIWALIAQGQFAEAEALIAEATAGGTLAQPQAARMLERIALLSTRLGQVPARLQRVADFPSQLREHTLFQIKQMLERRDYSLATQAQLKLAEKLLEQSERLMEKASNTPR